MAKYIDADRLRAEIIRLRKDKPFHNDSSFLAYLHGLSSVEAIIDSLQQERPVIEEDWVEKRKQECGYRKLSANGNYQCERYEGAFGPCDGRCSWIVDYPKLKELEKQKQPDTDIEEEIKFWIRNHVKGGDFEPYKTIKKAVIQWGEIVARYFYELGKNSK